MSKRVFSLLIGIDDYTYAKLNGCVNDSEAVEAYLNDTVKDLVTFTLRNQEATKANIVDVLMNQIRKEITEDDVLFVHYCGHGSREPAHPMFYHLTTDRKNEVMVTVDSLDPRKGMVNPLADKEWRWMVNKIAAKNPHITIMFDSCHSGGASRDPFAPVTPRFTAGAENLTRKYEDYIFIAQDEPLRAKIEATKKLNLPIGKHLLLAGCRTDQTSKELIVGGQQHGIFTYSVLDILKTSNEPITYQDLIRQVGVRVKNKVRDQVPQLETYQDRSSIYQPFLGGTIRPMPKYYLVSKNRKQQWLMNGGNIQGITTIAGDPTLVSLYSSKADLADRTIEPIMDAEISTVSMAESILSLEDTPTDEFYKALVTEMMIPTLKIRVEVEEQDDVLVEGVNLLTKKIQAVGKSEPTGGALEVVGECEEVNYRVVAYKHEGIYKYRICNLVNDRPLVAQTIGFTPDSVTNLVRELKQIARWERVRDLQNGNSRLSTNSVKITIWRRFRDRQTGEFGEAELVDWSSGVIADKYYVYTDKQGLKRSSVQYKIQLENKTRKNLYCACYAFSSLYGISDFYLPTEQLRDSSTLIVGQDAVKSEYNIDTEFPIDFLPLTPEAINLGLNEDTAIFKFIIATEQFESHMFNQDDLDSTTTIRAVRMKRKMPVNDWYTQEFTLTGIEEITDAKTLFAQSGITIDMPASLGKVTNTKVSNVQQENSTRSLEKTKLPIIPQQLLTLDTEGELLTFTEGSGDVAPLNMLEITDIPTTNLVNPTTPITIDFSKNLQAGDMVIPIASDGELYYPVGFGEADKNGKATVVIDNLPENKEEVSTRGLGTAIKIVFQKLVSQKLGFGYEYPYLAVVQAQGGELVYDNNELVLTEQIAKANKVLVVVHGFIGETKNMLLADKKDSITASLHSELAKEYEVILGYDYDSYNTPLDRAAMGLKNKLTQLGLKTDGMTNKEVVILAHSTGGLVSRWFIEKLGGNQLVNKLVMTGTPNNGTPWPKIKEWAKLAATLLLNQIPVVGWPATALAFLLDKSKFVEGLDKVSPDLQPKSDFLAQLRESTDPNVSYTVLQGNTSLIGDDATSRNHISRILGKIGVDKITEKALTSFLFGENNDLLVSVNSMGKIDAHKNWAITPKAQPVACDHMSYYNSIAGKEAILESLLGEEEPLI